MSAIASPLHTLLSKTLISACIRGFDEGLTSTFVTGNKQPFWSYPESVIVPISNVLSVEKVDTLETPDYVVLLAWLIVHK